MATRPINLADVRKAWQKPRLHLSRLVWASKVPQVVGYTREGNLLKALKARDGATIMYSDQKPERELYPPVFMVSGWGCYPSIWREQAAFLRNYARVIRVRKRGHFGSTLGRSTPKTYIHDIAEDLREVMDAEGIAKAVIMGHSMGGLIALAFYSRHEKRAEGLALVCSPASNPLRSAKLNLAAADGLSEALFFTLQRLKPLDPAKKLLLKNNPFTFFFALLVSGTVLTEENPHFYEEFKYFTQRILEVPMESIALAFRAMRRVDFRPLLPEVRVPTLVVGGRRDLAVSYKHKVSVHSAIASTNPRASLKITNTAHLPTMERPLTFNSALAEFLDVLG